MTEHETLHRTLNRTLNRPTYSDTLTRLTHRAKLAGPQPWGQRGQTNKAG